MANQAWTFSRRGRLSETLELGDAEISTPKSGEVTIEVKAVACNPVDVQLASSDDVTLRLVGGLTRQPKVPAFDVSGIVHAVGPDVHELAVGDAVFGLHMAMAGNGCLQRYATVPMNSGGSVIIKKPDGLSFVQAAAIPLVYSTVHTALVKYGKLERPAGAKERSVLILGGSGGTGCIAIQLAKQLGLRVVTTCSSKNIDFVKRMGADEAIDYTVVHVPQAALHSQYAPFAEILDCVGGTELMPYLDHLILDDPQDPELGIYITIVGDKTHRETMGGPVTNAFNPLQPLRAARGRLRDLVPSWVPLRSWIAGPRYACIILEASKAQFESIEGFASKGGQIVIDSVFPFEDAKKAYQQLESGRSVGKVVIEVAESPRQADKRGHAAYLGPEGSYSQQAAVALVGRSADLRSCPTISDVYNASASLAVMPLENTIQGVVQETLKCFVEDHPVESSRMAQQRWRIVQDVHVAVQHTLVVRKGTRLEDVAWVGSHEQALGQCSRYLSTHLAPAKQIPFASTATAAYHLASCPAEEAGRGAAICSSAVADELSASGAVDIVQRGVQNVQENHTRFLLLERCRAGQHLKPPSSGRHFLTVDNAGLIPHIGGRLIAAHSQPVVREGRYYSQRYLVEVDGVIGNVPHGAMYLGSV